MGGRGSGGKNRKPTAIKKAEGNRGKRKLNKKEPKAAAGEPQMPANITPGAKAEWPGVIEMLRKNEVLFETDAIAIAALCSTLAVFRQTDNRVNWHMRQIETLESEVASQTAQYMKWTRARSDAEKHLRATWQAFGLDPSSRAAVEGTGGAGAGGGEGDRPPTSALEAILRAKTSKTETVQ